MEENLHSKYLLDEYPVMFHSSLAVALGLNEAILLQRINLWLNCKPHNADGRSWIYNSYKSWQEQLPFFSESTIKRALKNLADKGIIIKGNFNKFKMDRTIWYSIDYNKLDKIIDTLNLPLGQNDTMILGQNDTTNTNVYTMSNKKEKKEKAKTDIDLVIDETNYNDELKEMIYEFIKMRKTIKKPMTTIAVKRLINKLDKFTNNDKEKIQILDKSIFNSWQDIYPLKQEEKQEAEYEHELTYTADDFTPEQYDRLMRREMSKEEMIQILKEKKNVR